MRENQWSLLVDGLTRVCEFSSIVGLSIAVDSKVVNAPIEKGSFTSYNKVVSPDAVTMTALLAGGEREQESALIRLRELKNSTELLRLVTPFESFENLNIVTVKWERTTEIGSTRTMVEITMQEVKQVEVITERMSKPSQCKNASSVSGVKTGRVAPSPVPESIEKKIDARYPSTYEVMEDK